MKRPTQRRDRAKQNDRSPDTATLYAWLSRDADGIEGVVAIPTASGIMPLVLADQERAEALAPAAALAAAHRGFPAKLVAFHRGIEIRTVGE